MSRSLAIILAGIVPFACRGQARKDIYLPLRHEGEAQQACSLHMGGIKTPFVRVSHPCFTEVDREVYAVTNGQVDFNLRIDLKKSSDPFFLSLLSLDTKGLNQMQRLLICHLSLVPARSQTVIHGNNFAITNLTSTPFFVKSKEGVTLSQCDSNFILGTFSNGGYVDVPGTGKISLKHN
jgi:hypothetical protein